MRCKDHRRYKGLKKPQTDCNACWTKFLDRTADYQMICKEIEFRTPKEESETSYARGFDNYGGYNNYETAIVGLLRRYKLKLEEEYYKDKEKKMEVVINVCFGGFGLSLKGQKEYLKLKGKEAFFYKQTKYGHSSGSGGVDEYSRMSIDEEGSLFLYTMTKDFGPAYGVLSREEMEEHHFYDGDIERTDPDLITVVKKLGEEANGSCASLRVVEIPDGIDWEIDEYDGNESVEEKHRSWS